jgi:phosphoglycolate phosphatase
MKFVDLMIYDLDGTLADTGADLTAAVNYTLTVMKLQERSYQEIIGFVGDGIRSLLEKSLGESHRTKVDEALKIFSAYYEKHLLDKTVLLPHVQDVLEHFRNKKKVILTNKRYYLALDIVRGLNIEKHFLEIIGADTTPYLKPDVRLVEYLLSKYDAEPRRTVIIGDGVNDVALAKNGGMMSCVYLNGLGNRDILLKMGADFYCESLIEIISFFI